jgi:hypothetical protein
MTIIDPAAMRSVPTVQTYIQLTNFRLSGFARPTYHEKTGSGRLQSCV